MIFLIGMLCLGLSGDLYAQYCLSLKYDDNGNRVNLSVVKCFVSCRGTEEQDVLEIYDDNDLMVYPNPNMGEFDIEINDRDSDYDECVLQIYDNKGVLIKTEEFVEKTRMDIRDNPAGIYLLRIIKGEKVCNRVVVKI